MGLIGIKSQPFFEKIMGMSMWIYYAKVILDQGQDAIHPVRSGQINKV